MLEVTTALPPAKLILKVVSAFGSPRTTIPIYTYIVNIMCMHTCTCTCVWGELASHKRSLTQPPPVLKAGHPVSCSSLCTCMLYVLCVLFGLLRLDFWVSFSFYCFLASVLYFYFTACTLYIPYNGLYIPSVKRGQASTDSLKAEEK